MFFFSKKPIISLLEKLQAEVESFDNSDKKHASVNIIIERIKEASYGLSFDHKLKKKVVLLLHSIVLSAAVVESVASQKPLIKKVFSLYVELIGSPVEVDVLKNARVKAHSSIKGIIELEIKKSAFFFAEGSFFEVGSETEKAFINTLKQVFLKEKVSVKFHQKINQKILEALTNRYVEMALHAYYEKNNVKLSIGLASRIDLFLSTLDEVERDCKDNFLKDALKIELQGKIPHDLLEGFKENSKNSSVERDLEGVMVYFNHCIDKVVDDYLLAYDLHPSLRVQFYAIGKSLIPECVDELLSETRELYFRKALKPVLSAHDLSSIQGMSTDSIEQSDFDRSEAQLPVLAASPSPIDAVVDDYIRHCKISDTNPELRVELLRTANGILKEHIQQLAPHEEDRSIPDPASPLLK